MRRWPLVIGVGAAIALACNALNGSSDLAIDDGADAATEGAVPPGTPPPGATPPGTPPVAPPPPGDSGDASTGPTYCSGIVFYARLDGTLTSAAGQVPAPAPAGLAYDAGRFGGAALFASNPAFYAVGGATFDYPLDHGTVTFWFKPTWAVGNAAIRTWWKPVLDTATAAQNSSGPAIGYYGSVPELATTNINPDGGILGAIVDAATIAPLWADQDWNFVASTWQRGPEQLGVLLNGSPLIQASSSWLPVVDAGFFRLGSSIAPPDSLLDDVAMWSRVLTEAELHAIHTAGKPLGDLCGL